MPINWRRILGTDDPTDTPTIPQYHDQWISEPSLCWAVPVTIADCGAFTDGLTDFDLALRDVAYGPPSGSPHARAYVAKIAQQTGSAYAHGYQLVPFPLSWIDALDRFRNDMLKYRPIRVSRSTATYTAALHRAQVYAGMSEINGWALTRMDGTEWRNGEPSLPTMTATRLDLPDRFPHP